MLTVIRKSSWLLLVLLLAVACLPAEPGDVGTPLPTVTSVAVETVTATVIPTTVVEPTATATATSPPAATNTAVPPTATATPIVVAPTDVTYVMALVDLNLRSGPGLGYAVVDWLTHGQIAAVTGVSVDGAWWQLACPSTAITTCWVSAGSQYTKPQPDATRIHFAPGATSTTISASMAGTDQVHYVLRAAAGQTMVVKVSSPDDAVLFHLQGLRDGHVYKHLLDSGTSWQGVLPQAQDYLLALNAIGGEVSYTIYVSITDQPPTAVPPTATPTATGAPMPGGPLYPVVDAESGYLLGGTQHGVWIDAQTYAAYLQDTERPYSTYTLAGAQGVVTGSPPVTAGVCSQPLVGLHPSPAQAGTIALVATWDAAPRLAQALPADTAGYREEVAALLQEQGLAEPEVQIDSVYRVDLEGDGVDEVLIAASRLAHGTGAPAVAAGDYALLILRKVVDDRVVAVPLGLDVYPEANDLAYPYRYGVLGLLDLSGDGWLEIIAEANRYEGRTVTAYEVTSVGVQHVLEAGCVQ